jgi:hypothetical protein
MWFWIFFQMLSVIVEVYLWYKLQTSTCFVSRKTCKISNVSNTCSPHCICIVTLTIHSCTYYLNYPNQPVPPHIGYQGCICIVSRHRPPPLLRYCYSVYHICSHFNHIYMYMYILPQSAWLYTVPVYSLAAVYFFTYRLFTKYFFNLEIALLVIACK